MSSYAESLAVLRRVIDDLNAQQISDPPLPVEEHGQLIGPGGALDSLGLVTMLVAIEDAVAAVGWKSPALLEETALFGDGASVSVRQVAELIRDRSAA